MKLWRNILVMTAAFSLASCSSDDDTGAYEAAELSGTWQKVYDEGVADAGMVQYTFHPQSAMIPQLLSPWIATSAASPVRRWFGTSPVLMRKYQGSRK